VALALLFRFNKSGNDDNNPEKTSIYHRSQWWKTDVSQRKMTREHIFANKICDIKYHSPFPPSLTTADLNAQHLLNAELAEHIRRSTLQPLVTSLSISTICQEKRSDVI
jgi:hypothetical protein